MKIIKNILKLNCLYKIIQNLNPIIVTTLIIGTRRERDKDYNNYHCHSPSPSSSSYYYYNDHNNKNKKSCCSYFKSKTKKINKKNLRKRDKLKNIFGLTKN